MTEKKAKGRAKKVPAFPVTGDDDVEVSDETVTETIVDTASDSDFYLKLGNVSIVLELSTIDGIDYIVTPTGEITLKDGSPLPEEHRVDPSHARIAAERKGTR